MVKTMEVVERRSESVDECTTAHPSRPPLRIIPFVMFLGVIGALSLFVVSLYGSAERQSERQSRAGSAAAGGCAIPSVHDPEVIQTVYEVGVERGASATLMLAAFEAGWVESHMQNLSCGDRDSVGVFQQRPSQGWGTVAQVSDVRYAATQFFATAEAVVARDPSLSPGALAQRVQRSAYPERYAESEGKARELLAEARRLAESRAVLEAADVSGDSN